MAENVNQEELESLVRGTIESLKKGTESSGFHILNPIEFELAVVRITDKGGDVKLRVVEAGGKYSKEEVSKIKFKLGQGSSFRAMSR